MTAVYRILSAFLFLTLLSARSIADAPAVGPPIPGVPPGLHVRHWVRLFVIGNTFQSARPTVWISPQSFSRRGPDQLTVLTTSEYGRFMIFAHSYRCSKDSGGAIGPDTVRVAEYAEGAFQVVCVLPREDACKFLTGILTIPKIKWSDTKALPVHNLFYRIGCGQRDL